VVEWLTLLLCIQEVPGSNLNPETGYPDWGFSWFSSIPTGECQDSALKLGHDCFLLNPFQFIIHLSQYFMQYYIVWVTEKVSLNKLQIPKILKPDNYLK
jgi:hypothetical protein